MPKLLLKLAVSIALFAIVLSRVDIRAVSQTIAGADAMLMTLAFLLSLAMAVTDAAQWQSVLRSLGHRISLGTALVYSIVGCFFGILGPSAMGVDIFRAAQMRRLGIPTETAVRAVVSTRLVAFVSLLMVIATGMPIAFSYRLDMRDQLLLGSTFASGIGLLFGILILGFIRHRVPIFQRSAVIGKFAEVSGDLGKALTSRDHAPASLLFSTLTHLLRVATFAAIAGAFHAGVSLAALYALIPISLLVAMIPITMGSWGVREVSVIYFLGWVGVPAAVALSISVTFGILRLVMAGIGGIVWVLARSRHYSLKVANNSN